MRPWNLSVWTHPHTGATRIYFNSDEFGSIKIWFEDNGGDYPMMKINAYGTSVARNRSAHDEITNRVEKMIREAGIDACSWNALLERAQEQKEDGSKGSEQ